MDKICYAYKYDEERDLYTVRRIDGNSMEFRFPNGLVRQLVIDETIRTSDMVVVPNVDDCIRFSSNGECAIFDFKCRDLDKNAIDEIFELAALEDVSQVLKPTFIQRLRSRFRR